MNTEKPLGVGLFALGVAGIAFTLQISVKTFNDDPGPQLFPIFGFTILLLCGLGMVFLGKGDFAQTIDAEEASKRFWRGATMSFLFVVYSVGLWLVGFYIATPIMVYAFYHVIAGPGRRTFWKGALYALAVTGGVHLLFATFLHTILPEGSLF